MVGSLGYYQLSSNWDDSGNVDTWTYYDTNDAVTFYVHYYCCDSGNYQEPYCTSKAGNQADITMKGSVSVGSYNPWSDPTPGRNPKCKINNVEVSSVKPDSSITITWTAGKAGTGNSIGYYSVNYNRYRNRKLVW